MASRTIYKNNTSHLEIEFDGEYFQITQTIFELEEVDTITVTKYELEEMLEFAKFINPKE